jgi:DNA-binding CsgD family transcriptional regulator
MAHFDAGKFETVVGSFYEAAIQTSLWPAALDELARAVGAEGASMVERRVDSTPAVVHSEGVADAMHTFMRENWSVQNYRFEHGIEVARRNGVVTESMIRSATELDREPMQTGFLQRFGLRWFAGLAVVSQPDADILMSIERRATSEPYSRTEVSLLRRALPHIQRAGQLALASSSSLAGGILWGLDQFGRPVMLLDSAGKVIQLNAAAERLLGNGVEIVEGYLAATSRDADPAFQQLLKSARRIWEAQVSRPVALPRLSRRPLIAHVAPIVKSADEVFQRAKALVMFVDPDEKRQTPAFLLQEAFGLTPAEARIALSIAKGEELRRAADANGMAFETARVHLKAIFAKTQTHRQVELALLINRLGI